MTYKELQEQAKGLGIPYVGVSEADLKKNINEALGVADTTEPEAPDESAETAPESKPTKEGKKTKATRGNSKATKGTTTEKKEFDVIIVKKHGIEVRKYTLLQHGPEFETLAKTYAEHRGYEIEETTELAIRKCSECGRPLK